MTAAAAILRKDLTEFARDRRLLFGALTVLLLALAALALAHVQVRSYERDRAVAEAQDRATWLSQGARNPHGAAHFNSWAFRPMTAMTLLEPGVTPYAGGAIWMEAHYQGPAAARAVEDRASTLDLGAFSLGWVIQTLGPLLVAVLAAGLVARERERGTLRLMVASGVSPARAVGLKARALAALAAILFLPLLIVSAVAVWLAPAPLEADGAQRLGLWLLAHTAYLAIAMLVAVAVSARAKSVDRAVLILIGAWALAVPLAPRLGAAVADAVAPMPAARAFWANVQEELGAVDVFDPESPATIALTSETLRRYGVERLEDLPVNFSGIQLDAAERHGAEVFDRRYGELHAIEDRQRAVMRAAAIVSPLVALQNVSAGLAGTDAENQRRFAAQAEAHRRRTVGMLNADLTLNAGEADFDYRADPALWAKIPQFAYSPPRWTETARVWAVDALVLLFWVIAAGVALVSAGRALSREDL